jgi:hypothetical protein
MIRWGAILATLVSLSYCLADGPVSESTTEADFEKTLSIKIGKDWKRVDKNEKGPGEILKVEIIRDQIPFCWLKVTQLGETGRTLSETANHFLANVKREYPDLNKDCAVRETKVDGNDAYLIEYLNEYGGQKVHYMQYFMTHDGKTYGSEVMRLDEALDEMTKATKQVMDSFKWTPSK